MSSRDLSAISGELPVHKSLGELPDYSLYLGPKRSHLMRGIITWTGKAFRRWFVHKPHLTWSPIYLPKIRAGPVERWRVHLCLMKLRKERFVSFILHQEGYRITLSWLSGWKPCCLEHVAWISGKKKKGWRCDEIRWPNIKSSSLREKWKFNVGDNIWYR
jgi:hypothetical protein